MNKFVRVDSPIVGEVWVRMKNAEDRARVIRKLQALWDQNDPRMRKDPLQVIQEKLGVPITFEESQKTDVKYWFLCARREISGPSIHVVPGPDTQEFYLGSLVAVRPGCVIFCPERAAMDTYGAEYAFVTKGTNGDFDFTYIPKKREPQLECGTHLFEHGMFGHTYFESLQVTRSQRVTGCNVKIQQDYWLNNLKPWLEHWLPF